ncbi:MAG: sulfotransferase [Pseudomonadales bacterium]|nr:sulfotransferase [Pseudomonadales bacterium]
MSKLKNASLSLFTKFLKHKRVEDELVYLIQRVTKKPSLTKNYANPYYDINKETQEKNRKQAIFITGRFRSGSTLLWNIFRHIPSFISYYEPFNERRWFDTAGRGRKVDKTHLGVEDYWAEYNGLEHLDRYYNECWISENLFMDSKTVEPAMEAYIQQLISHAKGIPVLQFNRIDFRLLWLRSHFPSARILHIYRHPRNQFCSCIGTHHTTKDSVMETFHDGFYLNLWCEDLKKQYPFLAEEISPHPYMRFYYLWKLSYIFGKELADYSICFEALCREPKTILKEAFQTMGLTSEIPPKCFDLIVQQDQAKWKRFADDHWFSEIEQHCERQLDQYFPAS